MTDLTPVFAGILEALGRPIAKAHREAINRAGHYRRTKAGALTWVEPHQVLAHIAEHGLEPNAPKDERQSVWMGKQAMAECFRGHNVVHAMYRKGMGWIDFEQGISDSEAARLTKEAGKNVNPYGIRHIWDKRNREHRQDPKKPDGKATLLMLPEAIAKGRILESFDNGMTLVYEGVKVILAKAARPKGEPGHAWLVSGFKLDR